MKKVKLISVVVSTNPKKKFMAEFQLENKKKIIHFGSKGSSDYTISNDEEKKMNYLKRHRPNEDWNDPMTAGSLSRFLLWNKRSLNESINDFKSKFNL